MSTFAMMLFLMLVKRVSCIPTIPVIHLDCPAACECGEERDFENVDCSSLQLNEWPFHPTQVFMRATLLDISGNPIRSSPSQQLRVNFPNLEILNIVGTCMPCSVADTLIRDGLILIGKCEPSSLTRAWYSTTPEAPKVSSTVGFDVYRVPRDSFTTPDLDRSLPPPTAQRAWAGESSTELSTSSAGLTSAGPIHTTDLYPTQDINETTVVRPKEESNFNRTEFEITNGMTVDWNGNPPTEGNVEPRTIHTNRRDDFIDGNVTHCSCVPCPCEEISAKGHQQDCIKNKEELSKTALLLLGVCFGFLCVIMGLAAYWFFKIYKLRQERNWRRAAAATNLITLNSTPITLTSSAPDFSSISPISSPISSVASSSVTPVRRAPLDRYNLRRHPTQTRFLINEA